MDYRNPDYSAVFAQRYQRLLKLRADPTLLAAAKIHYRHHPWDFVRDWGMTFDPRKIETGGLANIPFLPWERQVEYMQWVVQRWQASQRGLVEKSRDCGVTWLSVGLAVALWCFHDGIAIGFGSRKEALVDKLGDPDSIFEKVRHFLSNLPREFLPPGFVFKEHATYMRLMSPETGSSITGESGDNIGRGGRKALYFIDEAAFLERQQMVDAALSQTTNCQIDISTFNGSGNLFYTKQQRFFGTERHFVFDWRSDPRKDDAWYQQQLDEQPEEIVAQEIDRDPLASNTDSFIPAKWVRAAVDAHKRLGFEPEGIRTAGFDPADTGDAKATVLRHGSVVTGADEKKDGDITAALPWAYLLADDHRADVFIYDGDGMGAPVIKMDLERRSANRFHMVEYRGGGEVRDKDRPSDRSDPRSRRNRDRYQNFRAQSWTWLRERFRRTYEALERVEQGRVINVDPAKLISIDSRCSAARELQSELPRPMRVFTDSGKIAVESKKAMRARGVTSPNLADALVMAFSEHELPDRRAYESFEPDFET